jgi:hypothetical protein
MCRVNRSSGRVALSATVTNRRSDTSRFVVDGNFTVGKPGTHGEATTARGGGSEQLTIRGYASVRWAVQSRPVRSDWWRPHQHILGRAELRNLVVRDCTIFVVTPFSGDD